MIGFSRSLFLLTLTVAIALAAAATALADTAPVTPSGWKITAAGRSVSVDEGPGLAGPWGVSMAPDGRHALVTSSGQAAQIESAEVFDIDGPTRIDIEPYDGGAGESAFYGVVYRRTAPAPGPPAAARESSTPTTSEPTAR